MFPIKNAFIIIGLLMIVQSCTYYQLSDSLLKERIFEGFTPITNCDILYIEDEFYTNCAVGIENMYSINLLDKEVYIKNKFKCQHIIFESNLPGNQTDYGHKFGNAYYIFANNWRPFSVRLTEMLHENKNRHFSETTFVWLLFDWVKID